MTRCVRLVLAIIVALMVVPTGPADAQSKTISGDRYFGCQSREYRDKIGRYIVDGDKEAFKKALVAGIVTGECTFFKSGEQVFVTDTTIFSGLVKVRRKGETTEYWTNIEAIK